MSIQEVADSAVRAVNPNSAVDPTLIINLSLAVVNLLVECQKRRNAAQIKDAAAAPNLMTRWAVRRAVANHTGLTPHQTAPYVDQLLAKAANADIADLDAAIAEARSESVD